jgi:hypothetical protein
MKKLIFSFILLIFSVVCMAQTEGKWTQRQDFHGGTQTGDSVAGSDIITVDSITNGAIYNGSNPMPVGIHGSLNIPAILSGTATNNLTINMVDAASHSARITFTTGAGLTFSGHDNDDFTGDYGLLGVDNGSIVSLTVQRRRALP